MDRWSLIPAFVVIAVGLMVWYIAEPIVGYHLIDIWNYVKLNAYQWYMHDNSRSTSEPDNDLIEGWLLRPIIPYIIPEDDLSAQAEIFESGPRREVVYGDSLHNVTMTFYIQKGNDRHLEHVLYSLLRYDISKAVFFLDNEFSREHPFAVQTIKHLGYTVKPWTYVNEYDTNYPPTTFNNIALTDREILSMTSKISDAVTFLETGIYYWNSSIIAFTPKDPPRFQYSDTLLDALLSSEGGFVHFTDDNNTNAMNVLDSAYSQKVSMNLTGPAYRTLSTDFDHATNPETDVIIANGSWTLDSLQEGYPDAVMRVPQDKGYAASPISAISPHGHDEFIMNKTIIIGADAQLKIVNEKLLIKSEPHDVLPRRLDVVGGSVAIINSTITSWDSERNAPDINAYHPRPYLVARDGGIMDIINSSITHLGFPLGGLPDTSNARAALEYRNTGNFTIANSTIAHNYYGFYTSGAVNFKIADSEIYANARYGLDPHTSSGHFVVDSNHIHDNGNQGVICSRLCQNVTITNNLVEHNVEGIGLHWLTNSSLVQDNVVRYNDRYGIYIDKECYDNTVLNNTIAANTNGVGILDRSYNNTIVHNTIERNNLDPIVVDETSSSGGPLNRISENSIMP